jgi:hypothetical protein
LGVELSKSEVYHGKMSENPLTSDHHEGKADPLIVVVSEINRVTQELVQKGYDLDTANIIVMQYGYKSVDALLKGAERVVTYIEGNKIIARTAGTNNNPEDLQPPKT